MIKAQERLGEISVKGYEKGEDIKKPEVKFIAIDESVSEKFEDEKH